ncbi:MAG: hypothetical protein VZQ75_00160 [Candidatus Faecousia sp.]|nr:hypothetical protein [Candidatus Faecousia sp.]
MDDDRAKLHALAAGVEEALFEEVSLDKLISMDTSGGLKSALKNWLVQSGIEGSEELATSIANRFTDELISGAGQSKVERRASELIANGMSATQAKQQAESEWMTDTLYEGFSGFVSGGVMTGGNYALKGLANLKGRAVNAAETRKAQKQAGAAVSRSEGSVEALQAYAKDKGIEIKTVETAEQNAGESAEQVNQDGKQNSYSNRDYRSISDTTSKVTQSIRNDLRGKTVQEQQAVRDSLIEKYGEGIAPVINNAISIETAARVRQEYGDVDSIQAARNKAVGEIKDESLRRAVSDGYDSAAYSLAASQGGEGGMNTMSRYIQQRRNTGSGSEMSMNATVTAQDGSTKSIAITGMSEDGKRVSLADGSEVAVKDLQADADTTSAIQQLSDLDLGADATKVLQAYQQSGIAGTDGYRWLMDYATAYNQGRTRQISLEQAAQRSSLDERTVMDAYTLGQQAANRETMAGLEKLKNLPKRKGASGRTANIDTTEIKGKTMSKSELEQFELANQYAQALGVDMKWFSSKEKDGKFVGKNGAYENGKIYMDIHAGRNFAADLTSGILATMGHELSHFEQQYAPEEYQAIKEFLFEQIVKSSPNGEARLERLIWEKQRRSGYTLSRKAAEDEVVADACQKMLRDSKAVHDFASQQPEAANGVIRWLDKWFKRVRSIFGRGGNYSEEAQLMDSLEQDVKAAFGELWDKALKQAVQVHDEIGNIAASAIRGIEETGASEQMAEEAVVQNSDRLDDETLRFLDEQEHVTVYRAMQMIDGKLYPPMAAKVEGKLVDATEIGEWYQAVERPDLIDPKTGKWKLDKANGKAIKAAYNPYFHTSATPLNDQFSSAYKRPNIVVVEGIIPKSELTSGYKAQYAKDSVGETKWHAGPVASKLKGAKSRRVFLSRWFQAQRVVSDAEVADVVAKTLEGENIAVPNNVVTPSLLEALRERGVAIDEEAIDRFESKHGMRQNSDRDTEYLELAKDPEKNAARLQEMVDEAAERAGFTIKAFHGTEAENRFTVFDKELRGKNHGQKIYDESEEEQRFKALSEKAFYFAIDKEYAEQYGENVMRVFLREGEQADISYREISEMNPEEIRQLLDEWKGDGIDSFYIHDYDYGNDEIGVFNSEQIKSADPVTYDDSGNVIPLSERFNGENQDIRFSMREPVEQTDRLIAWHNMNEDALRSALELGGLAMPSWAIKTADRAHTSYGSVSVIAPRSLVDPKTNRSSMIFGGDAWTPVFPDVDYDISYEATEKLHDEITGLIGEDVMRELGGAAIDTENIARQLKNAGGKVSNYYKKNVALRYAYLKSIGENINVPRQEIRLDKSGQYDNKAVELFADRLTQGKRSLDYYRSMPSNEVMQQEDLKKAITDVMVARFGEEARDFYAPDELSFRDIEAMLSAANLFYKNNTTIPSETDKYALAKEIDKVIDEEAYEKWIGEKLNKTIEKKGIRNEKDPFAPSGKRRSFDALHYAYNLANIVKAMKAQPKQGRTQFLSAPGSVKGAALKSYNTVEQVREDRGRLVNSAEEGQKAYDEYNRNLEDILDRMRKNGDRFDAADALIEVFQHAKTESGIYNYMQRELKDWYNISRELAHDAYELIGQINRLPMEYFEGKTYDAVPFDETAAVVVPDNIDPALKQQLNDAGARVVEYKAGDDSDRLAKVNSVEGAQFSERDYSTPSDEELLMNARVEDAESPEARAALQNSQKQARQIRDLTRRLERLQTEIRGYEGDSPNRISVQRFTRQALDLFGIPAGVRTDMGELLQSVAEGVLAGHNLNQNDIMYFFETLIANGREKTVADETLAEIRDDLKGRKIYVNENVKAEFGDDWNAFRKRAFSLGIQLTNNEKNMGIGSVNAELAELYPGKFDADETDMRSILENMVDTAESGKTSDVPILDAMREIQKQTGEPVREQLQTMLDQFTRQIEIMQDQAAVERKARAGNAAEIAKARKQINEAKEALREVRKQRDAWKRKSEGADARQKRALEAAMRNVIQHDAKQIAEAVRQKQALAKKLQDQIAREKKILSGELRSPELVKMLKAEREKAEARVKEQKEQVFQNYKEGKKAGELRRRIVRHSKELYGKLTKPSDKRHIPEAYRGAVASLLNTINLESAYDIQEGTKNEAGRGGKHVEKGTGTATNRTKAFQEVRKQLEQVLAEGGFTGELINNAAEGFDGGLIEKCQDFADKPISTLNSEELETLWNTIRALEHNIATFNKAFALAKTETISGIADKFLASAQKRKPLLRDPKSRLDLTVKKTGGLAMKALENPYTFFSHYGEEGVKLFRALRDTQDLAIVRTYHLSDLWVRKMTDILGDEKTAKLNGDKLTDAILDKIRDTSKQMDEKVETFRLANGQTITLTHAMLMDVYLLAQRGEVGMNHLLGSGLIQPEIRAKGKYVARDPSFRKLSLQDVQKMTEVITGNATEKAVADAIQSMQHQLADWGNEASMKVFGYRKFTEDNYWSVKNAKEENKSDSGKGGNQPANAMNKGMAKNLVPHAATGMEPMSAFTKLQGSISDMLVYATWGPVMEDFKRFYNWKWLNPEGGTSDTVKGVMERYGGEGSQRYWEELRDQINNGVGGGKSFVDQFIGKAVGAVKGARVAFNLRVVAQQPTAYARAAEVISGKYLAASLLDIKSWGWKAKSAWNRALTHSPIAMRKDSTTYDMGGNISAGGEFGLDRPGRLDKARDFGTALAGKADAITWGRLWHAAELQVSAKTSLEYGTQEYWDAVNKLFTEAVDRTQVVDGLLQRPAIMRTDSDFIKGATSYMGEPLMQLNMLIRQVNDFQQTGFKATKKQIGKTVTALVVTQLINAMLTGLYDAGIRKDDEDKDFWERFMAEITGLDGTEENAWDYITSVWLESNAVSEMSVMQKIPLVKDVLSMLQGYDPSNNRMDLEAIKDLIDVCTKVLWNDKYTPLHKAKEIINKSSMIFGAGFGNALKDMYGVTRNIINDFGKPQARFDFKALWLNPASKKNKSQYFDLLFQMLENGDKDAFRQRAKKLAGQDGMLQYVAKSAIERYLTDGLSPADVWDMMEAARDDGMSDEKFFDYAHGRMADAIKKSYLDRKLEDDQAITLLMQYAGKDEKDAWNAIRKWADKAEHTDEDGELEDGYKYSAYTDLFDAVDANQNADGVIQTMVQNGGYDTDSLRGKIKEHLLERFIAGQITETALKNQLSRYCKIVNSEDANEVVANAKCKRDFGVYPDDLKEAFKDGDLSQNQAEKALQQYKGLSKTDAQNRVQYWGYDGDLSENAWLKWNKDLKGSGLSVENWEKVYKVKSSAKGTDANGDGKADYGTAKAEVVSYIDSMNIPKSQKKAIYLAFGWAASTMPNWR